MKQTQQNGRLGCCKVSMLRLLVLMQYNYPIKLVSAKKKFRDKTEKQRKLEEAKESARRLESEENAGRDPCLFSKRTAFDIRFDQIDDKPWERGAGDLTDFFNYG